MEFGKIGLQDHNEHAQWYDIESNCSSIIGYSGPLSSTSTKIKRDTSFKGDKDKECYVEITLDVRDDSVSVHNIKGEADLENELLASRLGL